MGETTRSNSRAHWATGTIVGLLAGAAPLILGYFELEKARLEARGNAQKAAEVAVDTVEADAKRMHVVFQEFSKELTRWVEERVRSSDERSQRSLGELDRDMAVVKYILRDRMQHAQRRIAATSAAEGESEQASSGAQAVEGVDKQVVKSVPRLKSYEAVQKQHVSSGTLQERLQIEFQNKK